MRNSVRPLLVCGIVLGLALPARAGDGKAASVLAEEGTRPLFARGLRSRNTPTGSLAFPGVVLVGPRGKLSAMDVLPAPPCRRRSTA